MSRGRVAAGLAALIIVVFIVATLFQPEVDTGATVVYLAGIGAYVAIGALLVSRVPSNPIGVLMLLTGAFGVASVAVGTYAEYGALQTPQAPLTSLARSAGDAMFFYPIFIALVGIPLVYPDGRLPSRRFRWVVLLTIAAMVGWFFGSILGISVDLVVLITVPVALGGAVTAVVQRFRRGNAVVRQQVKWLAAVVVVGSVAFLSSLFLSADFPDLANILIIVAILALFTMPFVIGMAILRYRLYEIDRIISRTLSYAIVTGFLGSVFVAVILVLQTAFAGIVGGGGIPVAISTLAVFALFQPVLRRVRRVVDRRFDRARYDGERTVGAFAERLRWETDMERVTGDLARTARGAVAPSSLAIWLRGVSDR